MNQNCELQSFESICQSIYSKFSFKLSQPKKTNIHVYYHSKSTKYLLVKQRRIHSLSIGKPVPV